MKSLLALLILIVITFSSLAANAKYYKVTVTRKADNVYKVEYTYPTIYIITQWCLELALMKEAILKWDGYSGELIFDMNRCDVKAVVQ